MRLAHPAWGFLVELEEGMIPIISLEEPRAFRRAVTELSSQAQGGTGAFVLSQDWEPIELSKHMSVITDIFSLDLNEKRALSGLMKQLNAQAVSEKYFSDTAALKAHMAQWFGKLEEGQAYPLSCAEEADTADLLKAMDVRFEEEAADVLERLTQWMRIRMEYLRVSCFACVNICQMLTQEERRALYRFAQYEKARLLLLECRAPEKIEDCERIFVVDKDLCEIYHEE